MTKININGKFMIGFEFVLVLYLKIKLKYPRGSVALLGGLVLRTAYYTPKNLSLIVV